MRLPEVVRSYWFVVRGKYRILDALTTNSEPRTHNQKGFAQIFGIILLLLLGVGLFFGVNQVQKQSISFPKAQTGSVPDAGACSNIAKDNSKNILKNGDFNAGSANWTAFGNANLNPNSTVELLDGPNLAGSGAGNFNGGVYQQVSGLSAGTWYHAFYATAQQVWGGAGGSKDGSLPILREVGIDLSGGTDPNAASVKWGRASGGQPDRDNKKYGGWKTIENGNNPLLTFQPTTDKVTYFIRIKGWPDVSRSDTWIDSAYLVADCGSGKTTNQGSSTGGGSRSDNFGPATASSCDPSKVKMSIEPTNAVAGAKVTLNMTPTGGEGTTRIEDELVNLENCEDNLGLGANFDNPAFWPKVPKYKTCTVKATPFKWTHKWKNCYPNQTDCASASAQCSKSFDSQTGEEKSTPLASSSPAPASQTTRPANLAEAIKTEFGVTMNGYSNRGLEYAYDMFTRYKGTKFNDLIKGTFVSNVSNPPDQPEAATDDTYCKTQGGPGRVVLDDFASKDEFVLKFTHELGHVIFACQQDPLSKRTEHEKVWTGESGITPYGRTNSPSCDPHTWPPQKPRFARGEDYAEMIAFYLNQEAKDQYRGACSSNEAPFKTTKYPRHLDLARRILSK